MNKLAKLPDMHRRVFNPHTSCEVRKQHFESPGAKISYPHTAKEKLQTRITCGLCDPKQKRKAVYVCHLCKKLVYPQQTKKTSLKCFEDNIYDIYSEY
jgi:hypothetical protein